MTVKGQASVRVNFQPGQIWVEQLAIWTPAPPPPVIEFPDKLWDGTAMQKYAHAILLALISEFEARNRPKKVTFPMRHLPLFPAPTEAFKGAAYWNIERLNEYGKLVVRERVEEIVQQLCISVEAP